MSIKAEFGWAIRQFEYIHLTVEGENVADFEKQLGDMSFPLYEELAQRHRSGSKILSNEDSKAKAVSGEVFRKVRAASSPAGKLLMDAERAKTDERTAEQLITEELDGKVISVEDKPWEREAPKIKKFF